jgi:hypothetical protein
MKNNTGSAKFKRVLGMAAVLSVLSGPLSGCSGANSNASAAAPVAPWDT